MLSKKTYTLCQINTINRLINFYLLSRIFVTKLGAFFERNIVPKLELVNRPWCSLCHKSDSDCFRVSISMYLTKSGEMHWSSTSALTDWRFNSSWATCSSTLRVVVISTSSVHSIGWDVVSHMNCKQFRCQTAASFVSWSMQWSLVTVLSFGWRGSNFKYLTFLGAAFKPVTSDNAHYVQHVVPASNR